MLGVDPLTLWVEPQQDIESADSWARTVILELFSEVWCEVYLKHDRINILIFQVSVYMIVKLQYPYSLANKAAKKTL